MGVIITSVRPTCTQTIITRAELRRSFAKALVRHNGPKNAVPSRLVASYVAQLAASPCERSLMYRPIPGSRLYFAIISDHGLKINHGLK